VEYEYFADASGLEGAPVDIVADHVRTLQAGDAIDYTGYPAQARPTVGVTRNGLLVAEATLDSALNGTGWLLHIFETCVESGIRLRPW